MSISDDNNTAKNKGKVIVIDMNRVNMDNMSRFKSISGLIDKSAFIGQMNIRGDKGYDDRRNYASIGSTGREIYCLRQGSVLKNLQKTRKRSTKQLLEQRP